MKLAKEREDNLKKASDLEDKYQLLADKLGLKEAEIYGLKAKNQYLNLAIETRGGV